MKKDKLSHHFLQLLIRHTKAFFFAPLRGSLTLEAAFLVPLFVFAMTAALQYGRLMEQAVRVGTAMTETSETMATAAYIKSELGDKLQVPELAGTVLSAVFAQTAVTKMAGDTSVMSNINMIQSSFLKNEETIDLILSYQVKSPVSVISLPGFFYVQRARARAWTGRTPSHPGDTGEDADDKEEPKVYVTATGSVYHTSRECSYLRLSTRAVSAAKLKAERNKSGAKYYACELCGEKDPVGTVYITNDGTKYHSTLNCSGLKRSVSEMALDKVGNRHPCSRCG